MEHLQWSYPATIGIPQLDEQHKDLHVLMLRLFGTLATDPEGSLAEFRYTQLSELSALHFSAEEDWLQRLGYPGLAGHREDHARIRRSAREGLERWNAPGGPRLFDLVEAFAESVQRHLVTEDHAFARWRELEAAAHR